MKGKLLCVLVAILLLTIVFSGCFEEKKELTKELSVEQIKTNFINAVKNVSSYKCTANIPSIYSIYNGSKINTTEMHEFINISVDISNELLKYEGKYADGGQIKIFWLDVLQYTGRGMEDNLSWEMKNYSNSPHEVEGYRQIYSFLEYIAEEMKFFNRTCNRLDDEMLNGTPCYVLQNISVTNNSNETHSGYNLLEYHYKYWIDKTNYSLCKYMQTHIRDDTGYYYLIEYGENGDRRYMVDTTEVNFYDYNIPVTIELPPEALQKI